MVRSVKLLATSDLHVSYQDNRHVVETMRPSSDDDWLIIAGDIGERFTDIEWTLTTLQKHFAKLVWSPGNHELWTTKDDAVQSRGEVRYKQLVELCRGLGVVTPEDPYEVFDGEGGPVTVCPLFIGYDYTWRPKGTHDTTSALKAAHDAGVVCTDEYFLHHEPYASRAEWCAARVEETAQRLSAVEGPTVLINHYPLVRDPTFVLRYPEFALWCGTDATADWHLRFNCREMVYGHLHIPRTTWYDGVRFDEVSLGYPREWQPRGDRQVLLHDVLRES
ncbi:metallophosphoesterase [Lentzea sp. NBRC 105346]|uniref:metallophosphoesterase family protein n=1 Tax=Lentzea sp. NBRC 105346 TaxID=3032205 RepID=UPI0024A5BD18|nr:metallophosphoesterase [Lentzea sp. NBRC 105346]GLZ28841.1 metallophosphoesterase [Lentzea sp. NBRC 105346]